MGSLNSFSAKDVLDVDGVAYEIFRTDAVEGHRTLPFSLKVLQWFSDYSATRWKSD